MKGLIILTPFMVLFDLPLMLYHLLQEEFGIMNEIMIGIVVVWVIYIIKKRKDRKKQGLGQGKLS